MPQDKLKIRSVLRDHGRLSQDISLITDDADLYKSGMTSHASVNVMLALEGQFDIEFPDHFLKRSIFSSIDSKISNVWKRSPLVASTSVSAWCMRCRRHNTGEAWNSTCWR